MTNPSALRRTDMVYERAAFEVAVLAAVRQPSHWDRTLVSLVSEPPAGGSSGRPCRDGGTRDVRSQWMTMIERPDVLAQDGTSSADSGIKRRSVHAVSQTDR